MQGILYWVFNLKILSCSRLDDHGATTIFASGKCKLFDRYDRNDVSEVSTHTRSDGVFAAQIMVPSNKQHMRFTQWIAASENTKSNVYSIADEPWRKRLGHPGMQILRGIITGGRYSLAKVDNSRAHTFPTCVSNNFTRVACTVDLVDSSIIITVYTDVCEPIKHGIFMWRPYLLVMIAAPKRYVRAGLLENNAKIGAHCMNFILCLDSNSKKSAKSAF